MSAKNKASITGTLSKLTKNKSSSMMDGFRLTSSVAIWKSRISWRIALAVTLKEFEQGRLDHLREVGRSAIVPIIDTTVTNLLETPFKELNVQRLLSTTHVNGLAVYSSQLDLLQIYGEPTALTILSQNDLSQTFRSNDGGSYEVIFRSNDLRRPYVIVARLDSAHL